MRQLKLKVKSISKGAAKAVSRKNPRPCASADASKSIEVCHSTFCSKPMKPDCSAKGDVNNGSLCRLIAREAPAKSLILQAYQK